MYVQRCGFRQEFDTKVERVRRVYREVVEDACLKQ